MIKKLFILILLVFIISETFAQLKSIYDFSYSNNLETPAPNEQPATDGTFIYGMTMDGGGNGSGAIYKVLPDGSGFEVLHNFMWDNTSNGDDPRGSLTYASGVLYGTTYYGGLNNQGTVFKINADGTGFTLLHSFNNTDGSSPIARLLLTGGVLYGTTSQGGLYSSGTIFRIATDGSSFATIHDFNQPTDGSNPHSGVTLSGNMLYGVVPFGPTNSSSQGCLYSFDMLTSTYTVLHEFSWADGADPHGEVLKIGNIIYGLAPYKSWGGGVVYKYDLNTSTYTVIYDGFSYDGGQPFGGFAQEGNMLYFITQGGSYVSGRVYSVNLLSETVNMLFNLQNIANYSQASHAYGTPLCLNSRLFMSVDGGTSGDGYLFGIDTDGSNFEKLVIFNESLMGRNPEGSLVYAESKLFGMVTNGGSQGNGLVFSVNPDGTNHNLLHNFSGDEGWEPFSSLAYESGVLYGMNRNGGSSNNGTIFKLNTNGSGFAVIHDFSGISGSEPYGSLLVESGTLYGTTNTGGLHNYGTLFKVNADGSGFTVLYDFDFLSGGYPSGTVVKSGNMLYGMTPDGGVNFSGCIYSFNLLTSTYTLLHEFAAGEGSYPRGDLTLVSGRLYGMTNSGGSNFNGTLFSLNTDGTEFTVHHHFLYSTGSNPTGNLLHSGDYLYGTTKYGGNIGDGVIFRYNMLSASYEVLGNFSYLKGSYPNKNLVKAGNTFFGMTQQGGSNSLGVIFSYDHAIQWTGATNTLWNEPTNWSTGQVPTAEEDVEITSAPLNQPHVDAPTSAPAQCYNLFIRTGAQVTIDPAKALTVTVDVVNEAGTTGLILASNASGTGSLIQNNDGVEASIQRYITGNADLTANHYHFVSIPIETPTLTASTFMGCYMHEFNPFTQEWVGLGSDPFTSLDYQKGYMVYYPNTSATFTLNGTLRYGGVQLFTNTIMPENYLLVPNPYPSAIDWDNASWVKNGVYDAVWIWNPQLGNYAAYGSEAGVNNGSNIIPQGQSFFVRAKDSFVNLATDPSTPCHDNTAFYKAVSQAQNLLRIKASGNSFADESIIRFREDVLAGVDEKDVAKAYGNPMAPQLSTMVDSELLSINSLPITNTQVEVPIHFESELSGTVTLQFSQMESFPSNISIRLVDKSNNYSQNVREQPLFSFAHQPGLNAERFSIVFGEANSIEEPNNQSIKMWITDGKLHISTSKLIGQKAELALYTSIGQKLSSKHLVLNGSNIESLSTKGYIVAQLIVNNQLVTVSGIVLK